MRPSEVQVGDDEERDDRLLSPPEENERDGLAGVLERELEVLRGRDRLVGVREDAVPESRAVVWRAAHLEWRDEEIERALLADGAAWSAEDQGASPQARRGRAGVGSEVTLVLRAGRHCEARGARAAGRMSSCLVGGGLPVLEKEACDA